MNKYLTWLRAITIAIMFIALGTALALYTNEQEPNYCSIYLEQGLTTSRVAISGGEREYALNGTWVKESKLLESCNKLNTTISDNKST